ncbi:MAG: V-type ATP synthase subunit D [Planctomycetes bacterium]|nr:V-type ATP synthase subunit D [Planctomycetota bacterium]
MAKRLQVNPTRMELMELRHRLQTAVHGHSLLEDKLEGLMAELMELVDRYKKKRREFNEDYPAVARLFLLAGVAGSSDAVDDAITQSSSTLELTTTMRNVLSVRVPQFKSEVRAGGGYSLLETPLELDEATQQLKDFLPRLLDLAEDEHALWLLMDEIQRTRRRVNALDYIMIPQLRETVKYVQSRLEENERANIVRLMKIKEMRLEEEREKMMSERGEGAEQS